jgi:replicative DNA helicase
MTDMLSKALDYAERGWYVFPCREKPGTPYQKNGQTVIRGEKTPYVSNGLNDATIDPDQIRAWWGTWKNAMIGVNAGLSGLFVVDIDRKHVNGLEVYETWNINDSGGLHSITPSGGMHIVFHGNGKTTTNAGSTEKIKHTGIDTRGEGGYFIAPPSEILEGERTGKYEAMDDWQREPGVIPDGLMGKLFPDKSIEYVRGKVETVSGEERKQLSRKTLNFIITGARKGERNSTIFDAMCDFAGCGYTLDETREVLLPVSDRMDFPRGEFEETLEKAYSKPRTSAIPDSIQEKIKQAGKDIVSSITYEEQALMEDALLACMIIDNSVIPVINDILAFTDFQVLGNRLIYKTINRIYNDGLKADFLTVTNEVGKQTDKIKLDDISKLINRYLDAINPEDAITYAKIIKEKSSIRNFETFMDNKEKYLRAGNLVDIIALAEKDLSDIALEGGVKSSNILSGKQASTLTKDHLNKIINGEIQQLEIGFEAFDKHIGGIYSDEFIICAARSGEGKSALALSILNHISITKGIPTALFSLEMSTYESVCRLICQLTGLRFRDVYRGRLTKEEWEKYENALDRISNSNLYFDDSFGITIPEIRSKIRKLVEKEEVKLIVIDQLEQISGYDGLPEYVRFDKITYDIKAMTKEFNIPIILNHQLNRKITDRRLKNPTPQLSDLNQAGEKAANQVWAITHLKDNFGNFVKSKISIIKNRNGPRLEIPVVFVGERMLFSNPVREEDKRAFTSGKEENDDPQENKGFWEDYEG